VADRKLRLAGRLRDGCPAVVRRAAQAHARAQARAQADAGTDAGAANVANAVAADEFLVACAALDLACIRPSGSDDDDDDDCNCDVCEGRLYHDFSDYGEGEGQRCLKRSPADDAASQTDRDWSEAVRVMAAVRRSPRPLLQLMEGGQ